MTTSQMTYEDVCDSLVHDQDKHVKVGYFVSSKIFTRFHLERQNKITRNGWVISPVWEKFGSNVYKVSLAEVH